MLNLASCFVAAKAQKFNFLTLREWGIRIREFPFPNVLKVKQKENKALGARSAPSALFSFCLIIVFLDGGKIHGPM